jgi:hypothetical protein
MLNRFAIPVRALLLAVLLTFAAQAAEARSTATDQPQTTARSTSRTKDGAGAPDRDSSSLDGLLIIVGIVGVVIFLAWACSRVGDNRSAT